MELNPLNCIDFYKADHRSQYPPGTNMVLSNFTPRSYENANIPVIGSTSGHVPAVTFFGLQYFLKHFLGEVWENGFFKKGLTTVLSQYKKRMNNALGKGAITFDHIQALHELGYLPIEIRAVTEGTQVPIGKPCLTIHNTHPDFFWLTNYLETALSNYLWFPCTSATTARAYRALLEKYACYTGVETSFVDIQAHDFSFRGMTSPQSAVMSGAAHLTSFAGTDTVAAIDFVEKYYRADAGKQLVGSSVPATEHSVMSMGGEKNELETIRRLITEVYPSGVVSIVSDTWDFWRVIGDYARKLKPEIMSRDGKVVFRPDSGDPTKIICGDSLASGWARVGAVEALADIFGCSRNMKGFKVLDPHVGLIYGEKIDYSRAETILKKLARKEFASSNIIFGIGSYTYQHVTRDTWGWAVKATYGEIEGRGRAISKNPKTDTEGMKKSACGLLMVDSDWKLHEDVTWEEFDSDCNLLQPVYKNGTLVCEASLNTIRCLISTSLGM